MIPGCVGDSLAELVWEFLFNNTNLGLVPRNYDSVDLGICVYTLFPQMVLIWSQVWQLLPET